MNGYMIGQRVIYQNVICTICAPERYGGSFPFWIYNPAIEHKHGVDLKNIKPLPNGQL